MTDALFKSFLLQMRRKYTVHTSITSQAHLIEDLRLYNLKKICAQPPLPALVDLAESDRQR